MLKNLKHNSLYYRLLLVAAAGIILTAVLVAWLSVDIMKNRFIDVYAQQTRLLLRDTETSLELLSHQMVHKMDLCSQGTVCEAYYTKEELDSRTVYGVTQIYEQDEGPGILIEVGSNGRSHISHDAVLSVEPETVWDLPQVEEAAQSPGKIRLYLMKESLVTGEHPDMLAAIRVLENSSHEPKRVQILLLSQSELSNIYRSLFDSASTTVELVNSDGMILSSNESEMIASITPVYEKLEHADARQMQMRTLSEKDQTIFWQNLSFFDTTLIASLHHSVFVQSISNTSSIIGSAAAICILTCLTVYWIIRSSMRPVHRLIKSMSLMAEGDFDQEIPITGKGEIRELTIAWNAMQKDLNSYISELMELEEQKRLSELHALQMQIQPHFMYNTLASFKILLWQNKKEELIESIDAFIALLRSTLGSRQEEITVEEELDNLSKYSKIMQLRFGQSIQYTQQVQEDCLRLYLPRQILQPFVENAYFHAFNGKNFGMIFVSVRKRNEMLVMEITDNGSGFEGGGKKDSFSGIGIENVKERLQLLYGANGSITVHSSVGAGTIVHIELPARTKEDLGPGPDPEDQSSTEGPDCDKTVEQPGPAGSGSVS